jgi:hypothetical protein
MSLEATAHWSYPRKVAVHKTRASGLDRAEGRHKEGNEVKE